MIMKECTTCKVPKDIKYFSKASKGKHGVRAQCKCCEKEYAKEYRSRTSSKLSKRVRTAAKYNLTIEEYEEYMSKPCGICSKKSEHLDHNHATGEVRGGLCSNCNRGLGHFQDDIKNLEGAIKWLQEKGSYSI